MYLSSVIGGLLTSGKYAVVTKHMKGLLKKKKAVQNTQLMSEVTGIPDSFSGM